MSSTNQLSGKGKQAIQTVFIKMLLMHCDLAGFKFTRHNFTLQKFHASSLWLKDVNFVKEVKIAKQGIIVMSVRKLCALFIEKIQ